jgi:diacylglycerol kinase family enzyme
MARGVAGQVVRELGATLSLRTARTRYRGHAGHLAAEAAADGRELVITFGGDGTINEVVNGLLRGDAGRQPDAAARPAMAVVPAGGANVFARTLGIPLQPATAARRIAKAVIAPATGRTIGLGQAGSQGAADRRYFTFAAGLGLDAEVVADVERARASGHQSSPLLYLRTALRRYYTATDRSKPALSLHIPGHSPTPGLFLGLVMNSSPWTYLGNVPVLPVPHDGQDDNLNSGLDVFALRRLRTLTTLSALHQMMHSNSKPPSGPDVITMAGRAALTFSADRPIAFHIDGEYLGETEAVDFTFVPDALRVIALAAA